LTRRSPGRALHVRRWGDGPAVVFLHGLGASSRYWEGVALAGGGYRGIAPDLLGFGRSAKPRTAPYDVGTHLDALLPLVPDRSVIVGHSTGAIIAAALAARAHDCAAGLLLVGLPAYPDAPTARQHIGKLGALARLTVAERPAAHLLCELVCTFRPLAMLTAPLLARDIPRAVAVDSVRHTWPSYSRTLERVVVAHRAVADLAAVRCPTLLLHGADDQVAPPRCAEALAATLSQYNPHVGYQEIEGDHHLPLRRPDVVAAAVGELVARCRVA
jgi:pimeloyl-ACP methyl ester carboxylesterase